MRFAFGLAVGVGQCSAPTCSESGRQFFLIVSGLDFTERKSLDMGVDHALRTSTASTAPAPFPFRRFSRSPSRRASKLSTGSVRFVTEAHSVGQLPEEEEAPSSVRGAHVGRSEIAPFRRDPQRGQVTEHFPEGPSSACGEEPRNVLQQDVTGSNLSDDPAHLGPEPPRVVLRSALPCEGDGLTGEACGEGEGAAGEVAGSGVAKVANASCRGPVLREDSTAELVPFYLGHDGPDSERLQPKLNPADARAERHDGQRSQGTMRATVTRLQFGAEKIHSSDQT